MRESAAQAEPVTVVGRNCEAGDVLAADVPLAADIRPGEFIVVAGTGACNYSMASTYRPAVTSEALLLMTLGPSQRWIWLAPSSTPNARQLSG